MPTPCLKQDITWGTPLSPWEPKSIALALLQGGMGGRVRLLPEGYDVDCLQTGAYLGAYMGMAKAGSVCTNNNNNNVS